MARILIVYGTSEGHTRKVSDHITRRLRERGHIVEEWDAASTVEARMEGGYDAIIIGSSVHRRHFHPAVVEYVRTNKAYLEWVPTAFFSVSLTAARDDDEHREAIEEIVESYLAEADWVPDRVWYVAGALLYRQYPILKRFVMRQIAKREGGDTDTSRNFEYTDWDALTVEIDDFLENVVGPSVEAARA